MRSNSVGRYSIWITSMVRWKDSPRRNRSPIEPIAMVLTLSLRICSNRCSNTFVDSFIVIDWYSSTSSANSDTTMKIAFFSEILYLVTTFRWIPRWEDETIDFHPRCREAERWQIRRSKVWDEAQRTYVEICRAQGQMKCKTGDEIRRVFHREMSEQNAEKSLTPPCSPHPQSIDLPFGDDVTRLLTDVRRD